MSSTFRRNTHVNSTLAYWSGREDFFSKRELLVLKAVERLKRASDREIMLFLGFVDPNAVRPRLTELVAEGLLVEVGNQDDPVTGKRVRVLKLADDPTKAQRLFGFEIVKPDEERRTA